MRRDLEFSIHKDVLLKPLWKKLAFEGRYILTASNLLQQEHGFDVILQQYDEDKKAEVDLSVDTKHARGHYPSFYLEEMSCTTPGKKKAGWLLKEEGWPDYIIYCFWPQCRNCHNSCTDCQEVLSAEVYVMEFEPLRDWFLEHYERYEQRKMDTVNKTTGRLVPIKDLDELIGDVFWYPE